VIELENVCWTCESPIDKVKPSKLLGKEEKEITIERKSDKKASRDDGK